MRKQATRSFVSLAVSALFAAASHLKESEHKNMSLDTSLGMIKNALQREREAGRINSLDIMTESQRRRETIDRYWQAIQTELASVHQQIKDLPYLPPKDQIAWAQAVLAMRDLAFLELDTTGLGEQDEIIRFTLIDSNLNTIDDFLIKPTTSHLSKEASRVNGITPEQLERDGLPIAEAWKRIQAALVGRYILSYSQGWDIQQLKKTVERHKVEPVLVIGDDLQRHCTHYYHREYGLTLAGICEWIGHPLPEYPTQTSIDRAKGQVYIMTAMANAVTDVRPVKIREVRAEETIDSSDDEPGDLDSHPF